MQLLDNCMYINAVADGIMLQLYLRRDFYNIIFKIRRKLHVYIASGSAPCPTIEHSLRAPDGMILTIEGFP
jgi:hypothetical protein